MMDPIAEFNRYFDAVKAKGLPKAEAAFLATASRSGFPSGRVVLLKGLVDGKLLFFTNYRSQKGKELEENPVASMVFWWDILGVQIRFEGKIAKCSPKVSDEYWQSRPKDSNISGSVSEQSMPLDSYDELVERAKVLQQKVGSAPVPRPAHWGGYFLDPVRIEFWHDRPNRLHLRENFDKQGSVWKKSLLNP